ALSLGERTRCMSVHGLAWRMPLLPSHWGWRSQLPKTLLRDSVRWSALSMGTLRFRQYEQDLPGSPSEVVPCWSRWDLNQPSALAFEKESSDHISSSVLTDSSKFVQLGI